MLKAWNTGHPGGITTVHANCAVSALLRLEQLIQEAVVTVPRDLIVQAVFGAHGERLLLKAGRFGRQDVRMTQVCDRLAVRGDGTLESVGCYDTQPYFDPLRVPPW